MSGDSDKDEAIVVDEVDTLAVYRAALEQIAYPKKGVSDPNSVDAMRSLDPCYLRRIARDALKQV